MLRRGIYIHALSAGHSDVPREATGTRLELASGSHQFGDQRSNERCAGMVFSIPNPSHSHSRVLASRHHVLEFGKRIQLNMELNI